MRRAFALLSIAWLGLAFGVICVPAQAQIYKCPDAAGKTVIQQLPCTGGQAIKTPAAGASSGDISKKRAQTAKMCESALRAVPSWKDPNSLQIDDVVRVGTTTRTLHDTSLVVVKYGTLVNARNSYGAYTGKKPAFCYFDPTETRLLDVETF